MTKDRSRRQSDFILHPSSFILESSMPYFPNTEADRRAMLEAIGAASIDELFAMIPAELRMKRELCVPPGMGELELTAHLARIGRPKHLGHQAACFLGGGSYDHFIPAVVDMVAARSEFYTAYTPYQAEASQGSLQAFFEYQTLIAATDRHGRLERQHVRRRQRGGRGRADGHARHRPQPRRHRRQRPSRISAGAGHVSGQSGRRAGDARHARRARFPPPSWPPPSTPRRRACWCSIPTSSAAWKRSSKLAEIAHQAGALFVVSVDPISLGLLKRPGDYGADIVVAEGQSLGNPMAFGGPYLGHHGLPRAVSAPHARPTGRPDGRSPRQPLLGADAANPRAAHPPRKGHEQHLHEPGPATPCARRSISSLMGPAGMRDVAELCLQKARYAAERLAAVPSLSLAFDRPTFKEFVVRVKGGRSMR